MSDITGPEQGGGLRTESRELRPFRDYDFLEQASLRLCHDSGEFSSNPKIRIEDVSFESIRPTLQLPKVPEDLFDQIDLEPNQLSYVIWLNDQTLKRSVIVESAPINDWNPGEFTIPEEAVRQVCWRDGTSVCVAIVLNQDLNSPPGVAKHAGNWIAQKTFRLVSRDGNSPNVIEYLTEEEFAAQGYAAKTMYVFDVDSDMLLEELSSQSAPYVTVKFSRSVAAVMGAKPNARPTKLIAAAFRVDFYLAILEAAAGIDDDALSVNGIPRDSALDRVMVDLEELLSIQKHSLWRLALAEGGMTRIKAMLQDRLDINALGIAAVKGL